jgi:hypothetical protein
LFSENFFSFTNIVVGNILNDGIIIKKKVFFICFLVLNFERLFYKDNALGIKIVKLASKIIIFINFIAGS